MQSRRASQRRPSPEGAGASNRAEGAGASNRAEDGAIQNRAEEGVIQNTAEYGATSNTAEEGVIHSQRGRSQSHGRSAASSEDSQTVLINTSSMMPDQEARPAAPHIQVDDDDVKKCWICFSDETEDTPETSDWRSPCPCALVAHEECLLDWIADMESPSSRKRSLAPPRPICPQCKTPIHLARPKNYVVEAVKALERVAAKLTTPGLLLVAAGSILTACEAHGRYSIFTIFGEDDGLRIMRPILDDMAHPNELRNWLNVKKVFAHFVHHWRLRVGLPLITPILILSRTSLADSLLPILPVVFLATSGEPDEPLHFAAWPPSASLAMAVLPYLRSAYNAYYDLVWAAKEKRWLKEIQPRSSRDNDDAPPADAANWLDAADAEHPDGHLDVDPALDNNYEIRIDAGIWEAWDDDDQEQIHPPQHQQQPPAQDALPDPAQAAHPFDAPPLADDGGPHLPPQNQQHNPQQPRPAQQEQAQQQLHRQEHVLSFNHMSIAEKFLGAVFFPSIAATSGDILRHILPRAWVRKPASGVATNLLQETWGRSLVGGCLFVVLKDAVMLYVRWRMACQHRRRRVLDYDRRKKGVKGK